MNKTLTLARNLALATELQLAVLYSLLIFFIPALVHQQLLTGPIINTLLILSFLHLGKSKAFFLAMIPSTVALSRGLLPLTLAPMLPFIMISNCLYIEFFARFGQDAKAIVIASVVKATFLFVISKLLMEKILVTALASKIALMMSWPQLATALLGGFLALLVTGGLSRFKLKQLKYASK